MKNRKRESCTSGTVRDEDGNILIYSARNAEPFDALRRPASEKGQGTKSKTGNPVTPADDSDDAAPQVGAGGY